MTTPAQRTEMGLTHTYLYVPFGQPLWTYGWRRSIALEYLWVSRRIAHGAHGYPYRIHHTPEISTVLSGRGVMVPVVSRSVPKEHVLI
jgi:hypothetical protein